MQCRLHILKNKDYKKNGLKAIFYLFEECKWSQFKPVAAPAVHGKKGESFSKRKHMYASRSNQGQQLYKKHGIELHIFAKGTKTGTLGKICDRL